MSNNIQFKGIEQIKDITFGTNIHWDVVLDSANEYNDLYPKILQRLSLKLNNNSIDNSSNVLNNFKDFFPIKTVKENIATITSANLDTYLSSYSFPYRTSEPTIDISFYDDKYNTMLYFFESWIELMLNDGRFVSPIADCVLKLTVTRFYYTNTDGSTLNTIKQSNNGDKNTYLVFPDTTLDFNGQSDDGLLEYDINFKVAGIISNK